MSNWHRPAGSAARHGFDVALSPREAGWEHAGLNVLTLAPGERRLIMTSGCEWLVLPLSGRCRVESDAGDKVLFLDGRTDPFAGPTDFVYVPRMSRVTVTSTHGARLALPHATAERSLPFRRIPADECVTELRGAGHSSRQVRNFGTPDVLNADSIIACEILTPAGNWSSYPPHKHDDTPDSLANNEEIYYFRVGRTGAPGTSADGFALHRTYTADGSIDATVVVRDGDVFLVPRGYHGPSVAAPGYPLYYLNVMAGPNEQRTMAIVDDPPYAWVRSSWKTMPVDPRVPLITAA